MRHGKRHLPYTVSTVLGLAAPALAALLLTTSTAGLAAVPRPQLVSAPVNDLVAYDTHVAPALVVARPAPRRVVTRQVVVPRKAPRKAAARFRAAPVRTVVRTSVRPISRPSVSQTRQPWGVDNYPYRNQGNFYAIDRWGFTQRQCVSFAAWRLAEHGHTIDNNRDNWGSAYTWDDTARRLGFRVTRTARVGAVAQWNAHESSPYYTKGASKPNGSFGAGGYGHVGWVKQVYADGSALVEQYNMGNSRSYSVMRVKAPRYLVIR